MKRRIYNTLLTSKRPGDFGWYFDMLIITLIILNVIAILLESIKPIRQQLQIQFNYFEFFSVIVFTAEYILRVWTANLIPKFKIPITGNVKYAITPLAIIDLLAFLPYYLTLAGIDLRLLRILRIFRIFRVLKIVYIEALSFITNVFKKKKEELVISLLFTLFLLLIASTLMYYVENESQPENFSSIPETMWWGISTLTTVGYGDIYPITPLGQFLGGVIAVIGIGLFALPTGILASGFSNEIALRKLTDDYCSTCGQKLKN